MTTDPEVEAILDEWADDQAWRNLSARTVQERRMFMARYFRLTGERPLEMSPAGVKRFMSRQRLAEGTRWSYQQHLRSYCKWLRESGKRLDDPLNDLGIMKKPTGLPRPVADADLDKLLATAGEPARTMILLAAFAGLRVHEIAKIQGDDVDWEHAALTVHGKGGSKHVIALAGQIVDAVDKYPRRGLWFTKPGRKREDPPVVMDRTDVWAAIHAAMVAADVRATPHMLRHAFGTALLRQGENIRVVQELMRHASLGSTQIYTKVTSEQREAAIKRLSDSRL